jgi:hypothetical protein
VKLCAEGALVNSMDGLGCSEEDIKLFWDIVWDQSLQPVCAKLKEMFVPKNVYKKGGELIQWKNVFGFFVKKSILITRMKESSFQNLQNTMIFFSNVKFHVIIAVRGTLACYHHVVVVWKGVVFEYESKYTYPLTNESFTQICRENTTFHGISRGYGIWPPKEIKKLPQNAGIDDWGYTEWRTKNSQIRKYFI